MAVEPEQGYWSVSIAPLPHEPARFTPASLEPAVEQASVSLRGWNFPHVPRDVADKGFREDYFWARTDWGQYVEQMRFHLDGLFTFRWRMREDGTTYRGSFHAVANIFTVAEIFEFARRLYGSREAVSGVAVEIRLEGVLDRPLSGDPAQNLPYQLRATENVFTFRTTLRRLDLLTDSASPSLMACQRMFAGLGYRGITDRFLADTINDFLGRGAK